MDNTKNALISVFDKHNLYILIPYLEQENYHIYSDGATMNEILELVSNKNIVFSIANYTKSPEICDGSVKTLHPKILGGILGQRENQLHVDDIHYIQAVFFDLIVVNLYPLRKVFEKYDIEGHTLLRAASTNYKYMDVLSDPAQYIDFIQGNTDRRQLAKSAFKIVMKYDIDINNWLNDDNETIITTFEKHISLNTELNPFMKPSSIYTKNNQKQPFEILNGDPGYKKLLDIHYAIHLVLEVRKQLNIDCCASYKQNSPAGVSIIDKLSMKEYDFYNSNKYDLSTAACIFLSVRNIDPISSFGDIIGFSGTVDKEMAIIIKKFVSNGIVAFDYTEEALKILKTKKKGEYIILKQQVLHSGMEFRDINGVTLAQPTNDSVLDRELLKDLPENIQTDMILGYITMKYTQSNCVCFVYNNRVIGIGAGQQNILDCIKIGGDKAQIWLMKHNLHINREKNIILVSDAVLQFVDSIDIASEYNVQYILQPGGAIRDNEIAAECIKKNIDMVLINPQFFT